MYFVLADGNPTNGSGILCVNRKGFPCLRKKQALEVWCLLLVLKTWTYPYGNAYEHNIDGRACFQMPSSIVSLRRKLRGTQQSNWFSLWPLLNKEERVAAF